MGNSSCKCGTKFSECAQCGHEFCVNCNLQQIDFVDVCSLRCYLHMKINSTHRYILECDTILSKPTFSKVPVPGNEHTVPKFFVNVINEQHDALSELGKRIREVIEVCNMCKDVEVEKQVINLLIEIYTCRLQRLKRIEHIAKIKERDDIIIEKF